MSELQRETTYVHTRLLKCALEIEDARAFWNRVPQLADATAQQAFDEFWFGARSMSRVEVLLSNMRARFAAFPDALDALYRWQDMSPETRKIICHWHLQLADPLYRRFSGEWLVQRHERGRSDVTRDVVITWVGDQGPERWTMATRVQFASKLLSCAYSAGIVTTNRDPRPLAYPRVTDEALEYFVYLLRSVDFEGTLLDNPYFDSVGLVGSLLEDRLRGLSGLTFSRQGDLIDFGWRYDGLSSWADARLPSREPQFAGGNP